MQVWPALTIRNGKCVRLKQGDFRRETIYGNSPADMALRWVSDGATGLHVVDLDGARDGKSHNLPAIAEIAQEVEVPIQVGGGIRTTRAFEQFHEIGINQWVIGTQALSDRSWAAEMMHRYPEQVFVSIGARGGYVASQGWLETTRVTAVDFAQEIARLPVGGIIFTDIDRDGMLTGPNVEATGQIKQAVDVPVIASGGITSPEDIVHLSGLGVAGCIVGRALYEGRITLDQAKNAARSGVTSN